MSELGMVVLLAGGTLLMRASLVSLLANVTLPPRAEEGLRLVAPALLAGLIAQTLILQAGDVRDIGTWHLAAIVAAVVAWRTRSVGWTLVIGMATLWLLEAIVG